MLQASGVNILLTQIYEVQSCEFAMEGCAGLCMVIPAALRQME